MSRPAPVSVVSVTGAACAALVAAAAGPTSLAVTDVTIRLPATPVSVSYDASDDDVYVATRSGLFMANISAPSPPPGPPLVGVPGDSTLPTDGALRLAPGGTVAVRSTPGAAGEQQLAIGILPSSGPGTAAPALRWTPVTLPVSVIPPQSVAASPSWRGRRVMLYAPVDDPSGHGGEWEWSLFDPRGRLIGSFGTGRERPFSRSVGGNAYAFRFPDRIDVRASTSGVPGSDFGLLHTLHGRYRFQSVSADGTILLAAPESPTAELDVSRVNPPPAPPSRQTETFGAPVHGAVISPSGRFAVAWLVDGTVHRFEPFGGNPRTKLPIPSRFVNVTGAIVSDSGLVTLALATRDATAPSGFAVRVVQFDQGRRVLDRALTPARVTRTVPRLLHAELEEVILHDFETVRRLGTTPGPGTVP